MKRLVLLLVLVGAAAARAQPAPRAQPAAPAPPSTPAACVDVDTTPGALAEPLPPPDQLETPIPWTDFVVEGRLVDPPKVVHDMLAPTLAQHRTDLSPRTLVELAKLTAKLGYQLVSHEARPSPGGSLLVLRLAPLPKVKKVIVDVDETITDKLLDEEVSRRMLVRAGSYLPFDATRRQCALIEERARIEEFLHDEGYFEAKVDLNAPLDLGGMKVVVTVKLGPEYRLATPRIVQPPGFVAVSAAEIQKQFDHDHWWCFFGTCRFTRTQLLEDIQHVKDLFHSHGYPAARVLSDFDPRTSSMKLGHQVRVTITTDPRRRLELRFIGVDPDAVGEDQLRKHLTFDDVGSIDDIEAQNSARSLQTYLQTRGNFEAHVTWSRERLDEYDRVTFYIDLGPNLQVGEVQFVCNGGPCEKGRRPYDGATLAGLVATKTEDTVGDLLGTNVAATTPSLDADLDRLREAYRRAGYRDARVSVAASPLPMPAPDTSPPSAALTAAFAEAGTGDTLHVRFTIDEGEPTLLSRVVFEPTDDAAARELSAGLCDHLLRELSNELATAQAPDPAKQLAVRAKEPGCIAYAQNLPFREDDVAATHDRLRDVMFRHGRPRAEVAYELRTIGPHRVEAHYVLRSLEKRQIGKILIRGNFRTKTSVITDQLDLHEGDLLTSDALAEAARRLRVTGLFDAVNIELVDLGSSSNEVNAVVNVDERYPDWAEVDLEGGYSSYNGTFGTATLFVPNLFDRGVSLRVSGTYGDRIRDLDGTLRIPKWLTHIGAQAEVTGLYRDQDTPRFGFLTTEGVTVGLTWIDQRARTARQEANTRSFGVHYDYRLRTRNIDALRPIGADMDDPQVAVSTTTGSVGVTADWDQRVDRSGQLSPLAPEAGFRLFGDLSYASPDNLPVIGALGGQSTFVKLSLSGSKFEAIGKNLVVRGDLRFDEGFPLGGAALLPDVERFFAGGDNTVRGYGDDRLATEIIRVGVPPLANISQIRVIPAGGDIRVLSSLDAQYHIFWIMAGAVFTDAGLIANDWRTVTVRDIRPSVGMGLRFLTPFGIGGIEYAVPLAPHLGDDPRGRYHLYFAARAQF